MIFILTNPAGKTSKQFITVHHSFIYCIHVLKKKVHMNIIIAVLWLPCLFVLKVGEIFKNGHNPCMYPIITVVDTCKCV